MNHPLSTACIQLNSQDDLKDNIAAADTLMRAAHVAGARWLCLPENAFFMRGDDAAAVPSYPLAQHPAVQHCCALARELEVWILIGSLAVPSAMEGKWFNRSVLIDATGACVQHYDKIHLFDAMLPKGEHYAESARFEAGSHATLAHLPCGVLGMTVCYDLRFPQLYRALSHAGATVLAVPAAFTHTTGVAHWHSLLRARAIENGCYVVAPAQYGIHPKGRRTYGHSLIVDPWGEVLADGGEEVGFVMAVLDPARVAQVRAQLPSLGHDREFTVL